MPEWYAGRLRMSKHYDVIVLGGGLGALTTAALLARRSWRVLVLGQGWRPASYSFAGYALARRTFTLLAGSSPVWLRVLAELAQSQTFRRRMLRLDPMLQVLHARGRFDLPPDATIFARELDREFPDVRRVVDELYAELARTNAVADAAFERDLVWPPGSFWEKRETLRVVSAVPHLGTDESHLLAEFPREHAYRKVVQVPARFACSLAGELPPFSIARLHGSWTRGVLELARGESELAEFLLERVQAHGGERKLEERARSIVLRHGRVAGVRIEGEEEVTGAEFIVSELPARAVAALAPETGAGRRALDALPRLTPTEHRFVVAIVVLDAGVPEPLAVESFLLPAEGHRPVVHLQRLRGGSGVPGTTLLVAEALLSERSTFQRSNAREAVLATLEEFLPFVERHYVIVDSPHDGRPLWDYRSGKRAKVDRAQLRATGGLLEPEAMIARWHVERQNVEPGGLGALTGEPIRAPVNGVFAVGPTVLPGLGQEGELLAAWGAARMITRTDRRKEKMRREMWSKVELS